MPTPIRGSRLGRRPNLTGGRDLSRSNARADGARQPGDNGASALTVLHATAACGSTSAPAMAAIPHCGIAVNDARAGRA